MIAQYIPGQDCQVTSVMGLIPGSLSKTGSPTEALHAEEGSFLQEQRLQRGLGGQLCVWGQEGRRRLHDRVRGVQGVRMNRLAG